MTFNVGHMYIHVCARVHVDRSIFCLSGCSGQKEKRGCVRAKGNLQGVGYKLCADEQEEACFLSIACVRMKFGGWAE